MKQSPFDRLHAVTPSYALLPILEGFNWAECLADFEEGQWYVVVFRSIRSAHADPIRLKLFDDRAYEEAQQASGLLLYFRGDLSEHRHCLSFCIWESQEKAQAATRLSAHTAAAGLTEEMYLSFDLERYVLTKHPGYGNIELRPVLVGTPAHPTIVSSQKSKDALREHAARTLPPYPHDSTGTASLGSPFLWGADSAD